MLGKDVFNKSPKETFENGISSIPADRQKHGLILDFSNEDNMILQHFEEEPFSSHGFLNRKAIREHAEELIEKFDVRPRGCAEAPAAVSYTHLESWEKCRTICWNIRWTC